MPTPLSWMAKITSRLLVFKITVTMPVLEAAEYLIALEIKLVTTCRIKELSIFIFWFQLWGLEINDTIFRLGDRLILLDHSLN